MKLLQSNKSLALMSVRKIIALFIIYALCLLSTQAAKAQTNCTTSMQSQPQTELSGQLMAALTQAGLPVESAAASLYGEICFNDQTQKVEKFTAQATNFDIRLPVNSLTDTAALGQLTAKMLTALQPFSPQPKVDKITITYALGQATNTMQSTITQTTQAMQQKLTGAALMQTLGYQIALAPTVIQIQPTDLNLPLCANTAKSTVKISNVTGLFSFEIQLAFDPKLVQVIDSNADQAGVQVALASGLSGGFIVKNDVDNSVGRIVVAISVLNLSGDVVLFDINWQAKSAGMTALTFLKTDLVNGQEQPISHTTQHGQIKLSGVCSQISGQVMLQGRQVYQGIAINDGLGQKTATDGQGNFSFYGGVSVSAKYNGYLTALADIPANATGQVNVGRITLLAGDVNGDDIINIFDLSAMSSKFNSDDITADVNGDGKVDIFDLSLAANNYNQRGPLKAWTK